MEAPPPARRQSESPSTTLWAAVVVAVAFALSWWWWLSTGTGGGETSLYTVVRWGRDVYDPPSSPYFEQGDATSQIVQFDCRDRWPGRVNRPRSLRRCSATWASAAVQCLSDRLRIAGATETLQSLSTEYVLQCACDENDFERSGCHRGSLGSAMKFLARFGTPSEACQPYIDSNHRPGTNMCPSGCVNRTDVPTFHGYSTVVNRSFIEESDMVNSFRQVTPKTGRVAVVAGEEARHGEAAVYASGELVLLRTVMPGGAVTYRVLQDPEGHKPDLPYASESAWLSLLFKGVWSDTFDSLKALLSSTNPLVRQKRLSFNEHLRRSFVLGVKNEVMAHGPLPVTVRLHPAGVAALESGQVYAVPPGVALPNPCFALSASVVGWRRTAEGDVWILRTDLGQTFGDHGYAYVRIGTAGSFETRPVHVGYVGGSDAHQGVWQRLVRESEWTTSDRYPSLPLGDPQRIELGLCARRKDAEVPMMHEGDSQDWRWASEVYAAHGRPWWASQSKYDRNVMAGAAVLCLCATAAAAAAAKSRPAPPPSSSSIAFGPQQQQQQRRPPAAQPPEPSYYNHHRL